MPWFKPLQDHGISAARYPMSHHLSSGSLSSPLPLPNPSLQSNSSKDLPIFLLLPTQAEHTRSPSRLTAFQQLFQTPTHPQPLCCLSLLPLQAWSTPPPLIYHPHSLTHLLPYSGHNICPNRSSEQVSKGKGKMCPLPGRDHRDSKEQQLESQGMYLDHPEMPQASALIFWC